MIPYFYIFCFIIVVLVTLLIRTLFLIEKNSAKEYAVSLCFLIIAIVFYSLSIVVTDVKAKLFVHEMKFIGVAFISLVSFFTYLRFLGKTKYLTKKVVLLTCILPIIFIVMALTNPFHLFRKELFLIDAWGGSLVGVKSNIVFWIYSAYSYVFVVLSNYFLISEYIKTPKIYRDQIGFLIFASLAVTLTSFIAQLNIFFYDYGDATLIVFAISAVFQYYGLLEYRPTRMINTARDLAVNEIKNPILIFDYKDIVLDTNIVAAQVFETKPNQTLSSFFENQLNLSNTESIDGKEIYLQLPTDGYYTAYDKKIIDDDGKYSGRVIFFNNITEIKQRAKKYEELIAVDYLTGLDNRHAFLQKLKKISSNQLPIAVIFININGMKFLNNILGNKIGDEIIKFVANILRQLIMENGFYARLAGDEFGIVLTKSKEVNAIELINAINTKISNDNRFGYTVRVSAGVSTKSSSGENIDIVVRTALDNMFKNKLTESNASKSPEYTSLLDSLYQLKIETDVFKDSLKATALKIGKAINLKLSELDDLSILCDVHDIGLIPLMTSQTYDHNINLHTLKGYNLALSTKELSSIAIEILTHHENYDGTGYPHGLKQDNIPILSRIIAVAECFTDALQNKGLSEKLAYREVAVQAGKKFDPLVVDSLLDSLDM